MKLTLVINPGNSTKKFAIYDEDGKKVADAFVEKERTDSNMCFFAGGMQKGSRTIGKKFFEESLGEFLLGTASLDLLEDITKIETVLIKVTVAGGYFEKHRELNEEFLQELKNKEKIDVQAYYLLREINLIRKLLPETKVFMISDSALFSDIPKFRKNYSLPESDLEKLDLQRFGFYGLTVSSVVKKIPKIFKQDFSKVIICNLGSGVSLTAVKDGKVIDTTMGFSFGEELFARNRAADLDGSAVLALMQLKNFNTVDAQTYLQTSGGFCGFCGEVDLRIILERCLKDDEKANAGLQAFVYQIQKAIGGMVYCLGGVDAFIFTATAVERNPTLRSLILKELVNFGFVLDQEKNEEVVSRDGEIGTKKATVKIAVIKARETREMLEIFKRL